MDLYGTYKNFSNDLSECKTILVVGRCSIEYWGRSRSVIGAGDRIVLFKPDSTIIVHSPRGFKPVNWMSPPSDTAVELNGDMLDVFSQRTVKPFEEIKIRFEEIVSYGSFEGLSDRERIDVTHTEADMRDYLQKNCAEIHPHFRVKDVEYKTPVGLIDIYGKIGDSYCVVELKSVKAGLPAVLQLKRYRDHMKSVGVDAQAILMAPSIAKNPLELMKKEGMTYRKFDVGKIRVERVRDTLSKWM